MSPLAIVLIVSTWTGQTSIVADVVTLRDGSVVRGEVIEPPSRGGTLTLLVRREWARRHALAWLERSEKAAAPGLTGAVNQRRERLNAWKRERKTDPGDRIRDWIDAELVRLQNVDAEPSPLIAARLSRGEVRTLTRPPAGQSRLLRLAWVAKLPDPESKAADDLSESLQGRGYDPSSKTPVALDALLPVPSETESAWLLRRAATEVTHDSGLRFLRYAGMVIPEPAPGQGLNLAGGLDAVAALKGLLGENPTDPLPPKLREVEGRGRIGAVVTSLDIALDQSAATVEMSLWVRQASGRWVATGSRSSRVRPGDLGPDAGDDLAADPQVAMAFKVVEGLGLGTLDPDLKRRSLGMGAATRKALGQARSAAEADLAALALPILAPGK
jgi:hypothetical protein